MSALRASGITHSFGELVALQDVSLELRPGARHAVIGPNGAGKTTLVNVLTGVLMPDAGEVQLEGQAVGHLSRHARVRRGLARTFQVSTLFPGLTVLESVLLAILQRRGGSTRWWKAVGGHTEERDEANALLRELDLHDEAHRRTAALAYGRQRLLEIALALASRPRVLLLDEPAAGIDADESERVLEAVARLPTQTAVLFIEHDMDLVFRFAERITVLVAGRVLAEGSPAEIAADEGVRAAYLGVPGHG